MTYNYFLYRNLDNFVNNLTNINIYSKPITNTYTFNNIINILTNISYYFFYFINKLTTDPILNPFIIFI